MRYKDSCVSVLIIYINVRSYVAKNPVCRKIRLISKFTNCYINRNSIIILLLTLNINTFDYDWLKEDIVKKSK